MLKRLGAVALFFTLIIGGGALGEEAVPWEYPFPPEALSSGYLVLVNRGNPLSADDAPDDLQQISARRTSSSAILMRDQASEALTKMFGAAQHEEITLYAHSGYRSYQAQRTMYANRVERLGRDDGAAAPPGASDHQTGLGIDVIAKEWIGRTLDTAFAQTAEAQWLAGHCWEYGFILRYPEGKEAFTQQAYEPWHLRYVGIAPAQYMKKMDYCLEEFTAEWQEVLARFKAAGGDIAAVNLAEKLPEGLVVLTDEIGPDGECDVSIFH